MGQSDLSPVESCVVVVVVVLVLVLVVVVAVRFLTSLNYDVLRPCHLWYCSHYHYYSLFLLIN